MRTVSCCVAAVAIFTVALAGTAQACNEPTLSIGKTQAQSGETVGFSISGTDEGAGYSISVNGSVVASGSDGSGSPGISGSFQMPDLGSESRSGVPVHATVEHFDPQGGPGTWTSTESISYVVPAPAAAEPAPTPRPERAATEREDRSAGAETRAGGQKRAAQPEGARGAPAPVRTPAAATPQTPAAATEPEAAEAAAGAGASAADGRASAQAGASAERVRAAGAQRGRARAPERPRPARAPEPPVILDPVPAPASAGDSGLPVWVISLLALGLLAGAGGAALAVRRVWRPGGGPAATPAAVWLPPAVDRDVRIRGALLEAELQEMIAEERARQATREEEPV